MVRAVEGVDVLMLMIMMMKMLAMIHARRPMIRKTRRSSHLIEKVMNEEEKKEGQWTENIGTTMDECSVDTSMYVGMSSRNTCKNLLSCLCCLEANQVKYGERHVSRQRAAR